MESSDKKEKRGQAADSLTGKPPKTLLIGLGGTGVSTTERIRKLLQNPGKTEIGFIKSDEPETGKEKAPEKKKR